MKELLLLLPEVLVLTTLVAVVGLASFRAFAHSILFFVISIVGLCAASLSIFLNNPPQSATIFNGTLTIDQMSQMFKIILLSAASMFVVLGFNSKEITKFARIEYISLTLILVLSGCVCVSSSHFLLLFLCLETAGVCVLFLIAMGAASGRSSDAAVKLLFYNFFPSLMFIAGILFIYLVTGSMGLEKIKIFVNSGPMPTPLVSVALGLISLSLLSRLALFPFHILFSPVVAAAPMPSAAQMVVFFSVVTYSVFIKIFYGIFSGYVDGRWFPLVGLDWRWVLAILSAVSMSIANLMALRENNLKKLIALAVIFNNALVLSALSMRDLLAISATITTFVIHSIAVLGLFFVATACVDAQEDSTTESIRGLIWRRPVEGSASAIFIMSLAALPPFSGFASRVYTVSAILSSGAIWLAVLVIANVLLAAVYYARLLRLLFDRGLGQERLSSTGIAFSTSARVAVIILVLPSIILGLYWDGLVSYISRSISNIMW